VTSPVTRSAPPPDLPGRGMTVSDHIARHARRDGDVVAFGYGTIRRTYRELDERVSRLANALEARGVRHGDRVALLSYNTLEVVEAYLACARLGAITVPVNFRLVGDEVAYVLENSRPAAVVVHGPLARVMARAREISGNKAPCLVVDGELEGAVAYEDALGAASPECADHGVNLTDPAVIMYTSGTTGRPKGAVLTHYHLIIHTYTFMLHAGMPKEDKVFLSVMPMFHIGGLMSMLPMLLTGGTNLMLAHGSFDAAAVVDMIEKERISSCVMVPTQLQAICEVPGIENRDLSSLKRIGWGAAPATTHLLKLLSEVLPTVQIESTFGQTEAGPIATILLGADQLRKLGSVGTPMLNVQARVVDDDMNDVAQGEIGEIVYQSPMVMKEYWNNPEATAEAFRGGWFHSGDLVRQDEDGYFYVVDRKKDMIISGGENIYCAEVENVIAGHPKVAEVALIGVPDFKWGETPLAVIIPRDAGAPPSAGELTQWCTQRLARYKRPKHIAFVDSLPRNPSGKVLKNQLRVDREAGRLPMQPA
jgi:fatty-acyl-CoA synthase